MRGFVLVLAAAAAVFPAISLQAQSNSEAMDKPDAHSAPPPPVRLEPGTKPGPTPQLLTDPDSGFRVEFIGREPTRDWTKLANALLDEDLLPLGKLRLDRGQDPCSAVLQKLDFRTFGLGCTRDLRALLARLNPELRKLSPIGAPVIYPVLPISTVTWFAGFDFAIEGEADRYRKVSEGWRRFKVKENVRGPLVEVEFRGFRTRVPPPASEDAKVALTKALDTLEHYDRTLGRYDIQIVPLSSAPLKQAYSLADTAGWAQHCLDNSNSPPTPPPPPPHITLLGGSKDDLKCAANCVQSGNCPQIVLMDQAVAPHPDVAPALIVPPAASTSNATSPKWCPLTKFDQQKHHGTHMAGLLVGSGSIGFAGLAPRALLESQDITGLQEQNIKTVVKAKNADFVRPVIFVFASQFPTPQMPLTKKEKRYVTPSYIADLLNIQRLWVVAAGQPPASDEPQEIGDVSPSSPMNLGDTNTVLVVTACENCYSEKPIIAPWANYSSRKAGLVNLAAFGGTAATRIPSTITAQEYGLAHGTSQAAALVGGLAASMMSCYPTQYANPATLKTRLLVTARPPHTLDVAQKVSSGIVDAGMALRDPNVHWVTLKSVGSQEKVKEVNWCKERVDLTDPADPENEATTSISVRDIRRLVRRTENGADKWYVFRQVTSENRRMIQVATLATPPDQLRPLLFLRDAVGSQARSPTSLEDIDDLLIGLSPGAVAQIPPLLAGCK